MLTRLRRPLLAFVACAGLLASIAPTAPAGTPQDITVRSVDFVAHPHIARFPKRSSPFFDLTPDALARRINLTPDQRQAIAERQRPLMADFERVFVEHCEQSRDATDRWDVFEAQADRSACQAIVDSYNAEYDRFRSLIEQATREALTAPQRTLFDQHLERCQRKERLQALAVFSNDGVDLYATLLDCGINTTDNPPLQKILNNYNTRLDDLIKRKHERFTPIKRLYQRGLQTKRDAGEFDKDNSWIIEQDESVIGPFADLLTEFHQLTTQLQDLNRQTTDEIAATLTPEDRQLFHAAVRLAALLSRPTGTMVPSLVPTRTDYPSTGFSRTLERLVNFEESRIHSTMIRSMGAEPAALPVYRDELRAQHDLGDEAPPLSRAQRRAIAMITEEYEAICKELLNKYPHAVQSDLQFYHENGFTLVIDHGRVNYALAPTPIGGAAGDPAAQRAPDQGQLKDYQRAILPMELYLKSRLRQILTIEQRRILSGL